MDNKSITYGLHYKMYGHSCVKYFEIYCKKYAKTIFLLPNRNQEAKMLIN